MIQANEYAERRQRYLDQVEENSLTILFSGVAKKSSYDEEYPFEVNRNFYYLTGIDQEDSILLMLKSEGEKREYLFVSPYSELKEKWYGKRLTTEEAYLISGVRNVLINSALKARLDAILASGNSPYGEIKHVYLDMEKEQKIAEDIGAEQEMEILEDAYDIVSFLDAYPILVKQRLIKSPAEIAELKEAIATTRLGVQAVMANAHPGVNEYELASTFRKVCDDDDGYQGLAFNTIMASGVNATTLHYPYPRARAEKGTLVLMDLGARNHYYCADVSRTIPVSGAFTEEQRMVYEIVLGCNKAVASYARPGISLGELNAYAKNYLASECLSKGLIARKEDIDQYYYHSVSHQIGLDTHDPGGNKEDPLQPGNVISYEPGLYIKEKGIGIRIEDDLLITSKGAEVLTKDIIKEIADIEQFYQIR